MQLMKKLFFKYQNVISNMHFILELMEIVLKGAIMKFQEEFLMQILGIVMGINLAPILANMYGNCKNKNSRWPEMFKRFIDDRFGVIKSNKKTNFNLGK